MITEAWEVDEVEAIGRLIELRNQLVDATENRAVLFNRTANQDLKAMLSVVEYIIGNNEDNPWATGWMATMQDGAA